MSRMTLRPYQQRIKEEILRWWAAGAQNVLAVLPTGAGKTVTFSDVILCHNGPACAIAHRQELVGQISLALARDGIRHRVIGPKPVVRMLVNLHMAELGASFYDPSSLVAVAGVDTLIRRADELRHWLRQVTLWVMDEAHHVLEDNKWGTAAQMFPNAKGLGVTATPLRADKKGLGRHADGLFDAMEVGPSMRELIDAGYLTDYRVFAPPSDLSLEGVTTSKDGDYNKSKLKAAVRKSHVVGDVVTHYLRIAPGKLGVTFATDVETATNIAEQFNAAGVPAAVVSAKTPDADRVLLLRRFKNRELLQLVNVDLFGEGFDLPAIEVVSFARPTQSYGLYVQQFGRVLRLFLDPTLVARWDSFTDEERRAHIAASAKPFGVVIDHVGNVVRHGLPDARREWTLDRGEKRRSSTGPAAIPVRSCPECTAVYERVSPACPHCGHKPEPVSRSGPEFVDGDLTELDAETLARMRGDVAKIDGAVHYPQGLPAPARARLYRIHHERQAAQQDLREAIAWWAGHQRALERPDAESYRRFYHAFGVDVLTAQTLNANDAAELGARINKEIGR